MRTSPAMSSAKPGRAVSQADAKAPAQLLRRAVFERAAARSWDACPAASASGVANTAEVVGCTTKHVYDAYHSYRVLGVASSSLTWPQFCRTGIPMRHITARGRQSEALPRRRNATRETEPKRVRRRPATILVVADPTWVTSRPATRINHRAHHACGSSYYITDTCSHPLLPLQYLQPLHHSTPAPQPSASHNLPASPRSPGGLHTASPGPTRRPFRRHTHPCF